MCDVDGDETVSHTMCGPTLSDIIYMNNQDLCQMRLRLTLPTIDGLQLALLSSR
jgi:hypothetical protein